MCLTWGAPMQKRPASTPPSVEAQLAQAAALPARLGSTGPMAGAVPGDHPLHSLSLGDPSAILNRALQEDQMAGAGSLGP